MKIFDNICNTLYQLGGAFCILLFIFADNFESLPNEDFVYLLIGCTLFILKNQYDILNKLGKLDG